MSQTSVLESVYLLGRREVEEGERAADGRAKDASSPSRSSLLPARRDAPETTTAQGTALLTSPSSALLSAPLPIPTQNDSAPRDFSQSAAPPPITALPAAAAASTSPVPTATTSDEKIETDESHPLASAAEDEDKMGKETAGDEGRGEEAGEGLSNAGGAALGEM